MIMRKYKKIKLTQRLKRVRKEMNPNSLVFIIKQFVSNLDYTNLEKQLFKSNYGQYPLPLHVSLGVWMYSYSQGILSYRVVAKKCKTDDEFYYLSEGFEPSPAYLEKCKLIIFPKLKSLFDSFSHHLKDSGIIVDEVFGLNGVKVPTWASLRQSKTEDTINKEINKIESNLPESEKKLMKINITSPSTGIMKKDGKYFQGVNVQFAINQDQFINVAEVFRKSCDNGLLLPMYQKLCGFWQRLILTVALLVDNGYWFIGDLEKLDSSKGHLIIIPSPEVLKKERKRKSNMMGYEREKFEYIERENAYKCPSQKTLTFRRVVSKKDKGTTRKYSLYQCNDCPFCTRKADCLGGNKSKFKQIRTTVESLAIKNIKATYNSEPNKELYKLRKVINEPVHGQMFFNQNIFVLHCIRDDCIEGEIYLLALISNLKKAIKLNYDVKSFRFSVTFFVLFFEQGIIRVNYVKLATNNLNKFIEFLVH